MIYGGTDNTSKVVENLFLKSKLLEEGREDHEKIRPVLVVLGGGMMGACGSGSIIALNLLGLGKVFDNVIGVSSVAGVAAYFLSGLEQSFICASIYYEDLPPRFIRFARRPVTDVDFVEEVLRNGKKKLNVQCVRAARSNLFAVATNLEGYFPEFLDVKNAKPDTITALKASVAIPGLYNKPVQVNNQFYIDGSIYPFPLKSVIDKFAPTDILVIANCSYYQSRIGYASFTDRIVNFVFFREVPSELKKLWLSRHERWEDGLRFLAALKGLNAGFLCTSNNITPLTRNPRRIRQAVHNSVTETLGIFGEASKEFQLL